MSIAAPPRYASPTVFFGGGGVSPSGTSVGGAGGTNPAGTDAQGVLKTFSPENYGATRGTTVDSTVAFQKAMDALVAAGGGVFFIPAGTWKADPPLIPANCIVCGAGMEATIVQAATILGQWSGQNVSNVEVRDFTFIGLANGGVTATNRAISFHAGTVDITNISIRRVHVRQCKANDAIIRIDGNGDLVTPATFFARRIRIEDCYVTEFYDTDPANIGVHSDGIYLFGGVKDVWIQRNYVDGQFGKHGIVAQSEANNVHIEDNIVINCGAANANLGYGITCYSSYTTAAVVDAFICRNTIINSAHAGIYLVSVGKYVISDNILDTCDVYSTGIGTVGAGAIMVNNFLDNPANGMGAITGNTIIDPGFCGIYLSTASFGRSKTTCTGNSLRVTTAVNRIGVVVWGRGAVISSNQIRGFTKGVFLFNTAANIVGDVTISDNEFDATGATAPTYGITVNDVGFTINPVVVTGNRFIGCATGLDIEPVTDVLVEGNSFAGVTLSCVIVKGIIRGVVKGNVGDGAGTAGLQVSLLAATAAARVVIQGNLFGACANPLLLTENTGQALISGNDFSSQPGITGNQPDANLVVNEPAPETIWMGTNKAANRTVTFAVAKSYRGGRHRVLHDAPAPGAFTLQVLDGGAGLLYTIAANTRGWVDVTWSAAAGQWQFAGSGVFV